MSRAGFGVRVALLALVPMLLGAADVSRLRAPMVPNGTASLSDPKPLEPFELTGGATLSWIYLPVVWRYPDDTYEPVISHQWSLELSAAMGVFDFVDVGIVLPVFWNSSAPGSGSEPTLGDLEGAGLGDLRILPRLQISDERTLPIGASFISELVIPTGLIGGGEGRFYSEGGVAWRPAFVASLPLGPGKLLAGLNLNIRPNSEVRAGLTLADEVGFTAGGVVRLTERGSLPIDLFGEVAGGTSFSDFFVSNQSPLELRVGARTMILDGIVLTAGVAAGLLRGIGSPGARLLVGVHYLPQPPDADGDGVPDSRDACPMVAEDRDGWEDDDGCPENDNDKDGLVDSEDECPDEGEDFNDVEDQDGCPDEGELDDDGDGLTNAEDACPLVPEDFDDFEDDDGCPENDNDADGIPDAQDLCATDKETINGIDDYDGCPDEGEGLTQVIETKIEIKQTVLFESGKSIIKQESKPLLDQVALQILAHPYILKVRIEGHTDALGNDDDNLVLSQDRADAVRRYLVTRGVAKEKLDAVGFGETQPIDTNDTMTGRTRNRRVEFVILQAK